MFNLKKSSKHPILLEENALGFVHDSDKTTAQNGIIPFFFRKLRALFN
jgi:hypothetical protein